MKYDKYFIIIGTLLIALLPSILRGYTYPAQGDDIAWNITALDSNSVRNYGLYLTKIPKLFGATPLLSITLLHYTILIASTISIWSFARRYSLFAAYIATPITILVSQTWLLWYDGSVLAIAGLLIFTLQGLVLLEKDSKWYMPLLATSIIFHKTTAMYLILLGLIWFITKSKHRELITTSLLGLGAFALWLNDADIINQTILELKPKHFLTPGLLAAALGTIAWAVPKTPEYKQLKPILSQDKVKLFLLLIALIVVASNIYNIYQYRLTRDLSILLLLGVSLSVSYIKLTPLKILAVSLAALTLVVWSADKWTSPYSAVDKPQLELISYINNSNDTFGMTNYEAPWILKLYTNRITDINDASRIIVKKHPRPYQNGFLQQPQFYKQIQFKDELQEYYIMEVMR